jgi:uncharacterized membrane protein (UPF0127 family)
MKNLLIPLIVVAVFIVAVGIYLQKSGILTSNVIQKTASTVTIKDKTVNVEVAKTPEERSKGLSKRNSMDANTGMLFVFTGDTKAPIFWMKDTLIPLDMIWIKNEKVVKIDKNVPVPAENTVDSKLQTYSAGVPVDYVLEVNAGFSDTNSIKVGDSVVVSGI